MVESTLKLKNANSGQLFRPDWVSSGECMPHRIYRTTSEKAVVYKGARDNNDSNGLSFSIVSSVSLAVIVLK